MYGVVRHLAWQAGLLCALAAWKRGGHLLCLLLWDRRMMAGRLGWLGWVDVEMGLDGGLMGEYEKGI